MPSEHKLKLLQPILSSTLQLLQFQQVSIPVFLNNRARFAAKSRIGRPQQQLGPAVRLCAQPLGPVQGLAVTSELFACKYLKCTQVPYNEIPM